MRKCHELIERVITVAEGQPDIEAQQHLQSCAECSALVQQLLQMFAAFKAPYPEPSEATWDRSYSISHHGTTIAERKSSTLAVAGVRGTALPTSFQAVHGFPGGECRIMYSQAGSNWRVTARSTSPVTYVVGDSVILPDASGTIVFEVPALESARLELLSDAGCYVVPSPMEA